MLSTIQYIVQYIQSRQYTSIYLDPSIATAKIVCSHHEMKNTNFFFVIYSILLQRIIFIIRHLVFPQWNTIDNVARTKNHMTFMPWWTGPSYLYDDKIIIGNAAVAQVRRMGIAQIVPGKEMTLRATHERQWQVVVFWTEAAFVIDFFFSFSKDA